MSTDAALAAVREKAGELFDQAFRAAGWTDEDFSSFAGFCIRHGVIAIAEGGEAAGMRAVINAHTLSPPGLDPATGKVSDPLLDRCMTVIRDARRALMILPGVRWAPYQESGIPDPAAGNHEPPAVPLIVRATGYRSNGDIVIYWEAAPQPVPAGLAIPPRIRAAQVMQAIMTALGALSALVPRGDLSDLVDEETGRMAELWEQIGAAGDLTEPAPAEPSP